MEAVLTAVVTNHNYAYYLRRCVDSALRFCDEVLVYDDGSTDDSLEILDSYGDRIRVTHRDTASGCPCWGSNLGITEAIGTHLVFLDADNHLIARPPCLDADYTFAPIEVGERRWDFSDWPLDADACWDRFVDHLSRRERPLIPFPWGGVWRTSFLRGRAWRRFETTSYAPDLRTALDWCKHRPSLEYTPSPFLSFTKHEGQMSGPSPQRSVMLTEADRVVRDERMPAHEHPDVVYLCRAGQNEELRYSLRSLRNLQHGRVWIFGGRPSWVKASHVPVDQSGTKWAVTNRSMRAACTDPRVSDPFILMNDDFYILEDLAEIPVLHQGTMREALAGYRSRGNAGRYVSDMAATLDTLLSRGYSEPLSYDLHVPMLVHKQPMLEAIRFCETEGLSGAHKRSVYGNQAALGGSQFDECKACTALRAIPPGPFLSTNDGSFAGMRRLLHERFPDPSPYERDDPVITVITRSRFKDRMAQVKRMPGDVFEATASRVAEINSARRGMLVEPLTEQEA